VAFIWEHVSFGSQELSVISLYNIYFHIRVCLLSSTLQIFIPSIDFFSD